MTAQHPEAPAPSNANDPHRLQRDDRGWFCLNCSWPGGDFTYRRQDALAHKAESVTAARG